MVKFSTSIAASTAALPAGWIGDFQWIRGVGAPRGRIPHVAPSSHGKREEDGMTCPYLKEVAMVFCRACPVKKLVPIDHVTTASRCEGEAYKTCPLFKEALERAYQSADVEGKPSSNEGEIK
jgi:hypothetical protein